MRRGIIPGLILLLLGTIFLLQNFGILPYSLNVWKLWPVMLIVIGLQMLFRDRGQRGVSQRAE